MNNRREFLKRLFLISAGMFALPDGNASSTTGPEKVTGPTRSGIIWRRNIFCQFDNEALRSAIEKCAHENDCTIFYGESPDPDIHACPAFVMIVDRNIVGHNLWREYAIFSDLLGDDIPCFIVDNIKDLPIPKKKYVYQFDLNDERTIPLITETIQELKREMDRRLPTLFKEIQKNT